MECRTYGEIRVDTRRFDFVEVLLTTHFLFSKVLRVHRVAAVSQFHISGKWVEETSLLSFEYSILSLVEKNRLRDFVRSLR